MEHTLDRIYFLLFLNAGLTLFIAIYVMDIHRTLDAKFFIDEVWAEVKGVVEERAMIDLKEPLTWPHVDVLPLKRHAGEDWPELGVLIAGQGSVVFLANAYTPGLTRRLKTCERINYASFGDIIEAGWVVD